MLSHEDQIVAAIRQIIRAVDLQSRRLVDGHGLTGPQLAVLKEVGRAGPTSQAAVARAVHLSQATVTGIVQRLQRGSLVIRQPSPEDRRSMLIELSAEGAALLEASPSLLQDRFRESLAALQGWERLQILSTLQRIACLMDAGDLEAAPHLTPGEICSDTKQVVPGPPALNHPVTEETATGDETELTELTEVPLPPDSAVTPRRSML
jgi:DNA-binding MarR family transcriptional regulator